VCSRDDKCMVKCAFVAHIADASPARGPETRPRVATYWWIDLIKRRMLEGHPRYIFVPQPSNVLKAR